MRSPNLRSASLVAAAEFVAARLAYDRAGEVPAELATIAARSQLLALLRNLRNFDDAGVSDHIRHRWRSSWLDPPS